MNGWERIPKNPHFLPKEREVVKMEFYVFNDYGDLIEVTNNEEDARELAETFDGYYCTDEN